MLPCSSKLSVQLLQHLLCLLQFDSFLSQGLCCTSTVLQSQAEAILSCQRFALASSGNAVLQLHSVLHVVLKTSRLDKNFVPHMPNTCARTCHVWFVIHVSIVMIIVILKSS